MFNSRSVRLAGALTAGGAAVALLSSAAVGSGAYFSDRHDGSVNGTFGQVSVDVTPVGNDSLKWDWSGMLPGEWQTASMTVTNTGTKAEDVYLAFDDSNGEWSAINTLGTYGEAQVSSDLNGTHDYNNLKNGYVQGTAANPGQVNACGDAVPAISYLPAENFLGTLAKGASETVTFKFRYTACLGNDTVDTHGNHIVFNHDGNPAFAGPLNFGVIATQPGVKPDDSHNRYHNLDGSGVIYTAPAAANQ